MLLGTLSISIHGMGAYAAQKPAGAEHAREKGAPPAKDAAPAPAKGAPKAGSADAPIHIDSKGSILMEVYSGQTLFEQDADTPIEPASFTKVLTLYLVFEALQRGVIHMDDEVFISKEAWSTGGSKMFVGVGEKVPLEDLIKGIAIDSGNDACIAVAEHVSGGVEAFVSAMNNKAQELGMTGSRFLNPNGLPIDGQITTARDMGKLGMAYLQHFPEALRFHSMREFTYKNITQTNRNRLLFKDQSVDGLKTGYVTAAGYHLSATAQRDGMRLLAVVMGAENPHVREVEAMKLLSYGFHQFALLQPFQVNDPIASIKLWKGVKDKIDLYAADKVVLLVSRGQKSGVKWEVHPDPDATAPVAVAQPFGEIVFYQNGTPVRTIPLVSREEVKRAGFVKCAWHTIYQIRKMNWLLAGGILAGTVMGLILLLFVLTHRPAPRNTRNRGL